MLKLVTPVAAAAAVARPDGEDQKSMREVEAPPVKREGEETVVVCVRHCCDVSGDKLVWAGLGGKKQRRECDSERLF